MKQNNNQKRALRHLLFSLSLILISPAAYSLEVVWRGAMISSIIAYMSSNPLEMDQLGFELGYHTERDITALKLSNAWQTKKGLLENKDYRLDTQLRFNLGFWKLGVFETQEEQFKRHQSNSTNAELGIHFAHHIKGFPLSIETLSGITYLSTNRLGSVEYGSNIGFVNGVIFAYKKSHDTSLNLSYLHYSNNDLSEDNPPDNFIYFGYQQQFSIN